VTFELWLVTGSGEANFVYFQCLAYNVFLVQLTVEFTGASLRRDKALRLTEKTIMNKSNKNGERIGGHETEETTVEEAREGKEDE